MSIAMRKISEDNTNKLNRSETMETSIIPFVQSYEKRMSEYMGSIPHIPPTQFELKVRHQDIKSEVMKQFKNANSQAKPLTGKQLENQIEKVYGVLAKKNLNEYKTCQCGFTIGWKCNVNKPHSKPSPTDDRF